MTYWCAREQLSPADRLRRSYYQLLRDDLDGHVLRYALIDSYNNFCRKQEKYPFVEKRELKPRALIPDVEYECQNAFLVLFLEDAIPAVDKKYIRFFDVNKTTKTNLLRSKTLPINDKFDRTQKHLESTRFIDFLNILLPVDYALLIQRDTASKKKARYSLSHFHVRIDWPIADAAENMAQYLRYISKDLYERGDKYAEDIQKKFFDYYGLPVMAGGRRTAAVVAAQYLKRIPCISTVYAGSSESRAVFRFCESGFSKSVLMKLKADEIRQIARRHGLSTKAFKKNYIIGHQGRSGIAIFQATYAHTEHAWPPADGKLRDLKHDFNWVSVSGQYLLPKPGTMLYPPLPMNVIYS